MSNGPDVMFTIVPTIIGIGFVLILAFILVTIVGGISESIRIGRLPIEETPAHVVAKRQDTSGMSDGPVSTTYYVTFEFAGGRREELRTPGEQFGLLAEGDLGMLTRQGPRFLSFDPRRV